MYIEFYSKTIKNTEVKNTVKKVVEIINCNNTELVGKPEVKRPMGRPRRRWEDNIKMDLQEVGGVVRTGWSWLRIGTGGGHL